MKLLYVTSLSGKRLNGFMRSAVEAARSLNIDFTIACNTCDADKKGYKEDCKYYGIKLVHIDFERFPLNIKNIKAMKQLLTLMKQEKFDAVHCNTPIGGAVGRICAHKAKVPCVIYQAHGFHFWRGAPIINWLLYYPVERILAHYTDVLITINKEDYARALKFKAKKVYYVPGVGIDIKKFSHNLLSKEEKERLRISLGVSSKDKMILSVGELNKNKNHEISIRAIAKLKTKQIKYFICGDGKLKNYLNRLIKQLGIEDKVKLLGYRKDIMEILQCSDLFIFPSLREGLSCALMEAIASKTAVLCSNIRGNRELVGEDSLFELDDVEELSNKIKEKIESDNTKSIAENYEILRKFDLSVVESRMTNIYQWGGVYKQQQFRKYFSIPLNAFLILSVGELNKNKNHEVVIKAIANLKDKQIHFVIAGSGKLRDYLLTLSENLGIRQQIHLVGYQMQIENFYRMADVFAFPSKREGLGAAAIEAMASGLPIITSNAGGIKDYSQNGKTGYMVSPNDIKGFSHAIKILKNTPSLRKKMSEYNKSYAKKYDINIVREKMKEIYEGLHITK